MSSQWQSPQGNKKKRRTKHKKHPADKTGTENRHSSLELHFSFPLLKMNVLSCEKHCKCCHFVWCSLSVTSWRSGGAVCVNDVMKEAGWCTSVKYFTSQPFSALTGKQTLWSHWGTMDCLKCFFSLMTDRTTKLTQSADGNILFSAVRPTGVFTVFPPIPHPSQ